MLEQVAIGILFGAVVVILIDRWMGQIQAPVPVQQQPGLFGDTFDVWRLAKVPEREAAQTIRRADRLGYKLVQYMSDKAGSVYILFQLCPSRRQLLGV